VATGRARPTGSPALARRARVGPALYRPAPRTRGHTWLPPPALRRSRPPPPWKPQAAGRVILACARAAAAPARYRTHLARVRGDSVPHPTPESRPPATPEPHPTPRTRVLGHGRSVRSRARTCRARRPSGAAVLQQRRVPGPRTVRRSSYNTGGCTPGSARHRDGHPQPCCTPVTSAHAHLGPLVRRWVRLGVGHAVGGRARGRRLRLALRGHVWTEGADGDRRRSRPRPWWARSSALEPTTRSSPEMPQVLVRGVVL
jgi:hypothetical protein